MKDKLSNTVAFGQKELLASLLSQEQKRVFPLSLAQQRLWFLDRLHPESPAYNVPLGLRLHGNLHPGALELSVHELIERHEILRTRFEVEAGQPFQVVTDNSAIEIPVLDLTGIASGDRESEAHKIGLAEARIPFNLRTGPLLRMKLIRLAPEEHLLLSVMHHIVCDGWSLEIIVRELAAFYGQHSGGRSASLADLPIQYGDYAKWQRERVAVELLRDQARYWKEKLAGASALLHLPADYPRPSEETYDGASQVIPIPNELVHELAELGRTKRSTLFMVMLAAFKTLLHCYAGTDDILVGVPVAGRNNIELENLVGFFVNTLVLRTDLSGDPHFSDLLLREREVALDAFAHADLPFEKLVEEVNPPRSLSYSPVFQVMFSAVKARKHPRFGDVFASPYIFASHTSIFDLSMEFIEDAGDTWWLRVEYATHLFDSARMARMLEHYLTLLRAIAKQPELRISRLASLLVGQEAAPTHTLSAGEASHTAISHRAALDSHPEDAIEPPDALEQILVRIWERVLGVSGIGIRDNFFDLGGHSLLAARLVSEVEKAVGRTVPLSALFRGSTIESFAEMIRCGAEGNPDPLLLEINAGSRGFPLFAIVHAGVDALGYSLLSRRLGAERPLYRLQAHAFTSQSVPFGIEELRATSRDYIAAMRTIQPNGPFFLITMCNGVDIAEQMVIDLEGQGEEVGFLGVIDTYVSQHSDIRLLTRFESFRAGRQRVSRLPLSAQVSHYTHVVKRRLRQLFLREPAPYNAWVKAAWSIRESLPKQFRAPVILFKGPAQPYYKVKDRELGWGARSSSGVKVRMVDAPHLEMLREPAVQTIAEQLKDALLRMEEGHSLNARAG